MPETIEPIILDAGMVCAAPTQLVPASRSEQLFNFYYSGAAPERRPGSTFFARLGEGPVVGIHQHEFEVSLGEPVLVAVVGAAYPTAWALAQDGEGAPGDGFAFVPDVRHGGPSFPVPADEGDRFTFASLFDRVYFAGSSAAPRVRFYDYTLRQYGFVPNLYACGVVSHRQRLYAYGDPYHPNYLYPSEFADPETFRPELAIQIGSTNARLVSVVSGFDRLLIFTTSGVWQYDGYAVEQGDVDLRGVDAESSVASARGACVGGGFAWWLDPKSGPCRWRPGMEAADTSFADAVRQVFNRASPGSRGTATVDYDDLHGAVHFAFSLEGGAPDYQVSFFPRGDGGVWTHSASTTDTRMVGSLRLSDGSATYLGGRGLTPGFFPGAGLYTCMLSRADPLSGGSQVLLGDEDGFLWRVAAGAPKDKARGNGAHPGRAFTSLWRSGTIELANLARTAMVHRVTLDLETRGDFAFEFRVERDHSRLFRRTHVVEVDEYPGELGVDFVLDESPLSRGTPMPLHWRVPLWKHGIGKVLRYEIETQAPLLVLGLEHELSRTAR